MNRALKKRALPFATRLFALPAFQRLPAILEKTGAALQSKRGGGYEAVRQEVEGALNFITRPDPVIFDVGTNIGSWTALIRKRLPDVRKIVMFEPQPSCWPLLEKMAGYQLLLEKKAVSDVPGTCDFWSNENSEISSFYEKAGGGRESHRLRVECITIDDYIANNAIDTVDYMKIDVEGHELSVIKGAQKSIDKKIIKAFSFEFGVADIASRTFFADFWDHLTNLGFSIYRIGHDGFAISIPHYSHDLEYFSGVANYIASFAAPIKCR